MAMKEAAPFYMTQDLLSTQLDNNLSNHITRWRAVAEFWKPEWLLRLFKRKFLKHFYQIE
jgi:hypothetical protein